MPVNNFDLCLQQYCAAYYQSSVVAKPQVEVVKSIDCCHNLQTI